VTAPEAGRGGASARGAETGVGPGAEPGRRAGPGAGPTPAERLWSLTVAAARPLLPLAGLLSEKVARGVDARRRAVAELETWAASGRDPDLPLLWVHGASAGELLAAVPALEALRARRDLQLLVTHFSPSGAAAVPALSPDAASPLPLDTLGQTGRALDAVRPAALAFSKLDVWPALTASAAGRGVPLGLVNGTVRPDSSRLRWPSRPLLHDAYARIGRAGAVSGEDAARLERIGVRPEALQVTGDAAFDRASARIEEARRPGSAAERLRAALPADAPVLLGGSTWRRDETLLIGAAADLAAAGRPVSLVLAPHEPDRGAVERVTALSRRLLGCEPRLWSEVGGAAARRADEGPHAPALLAPLLVDSVGLLAGLYAVADLAYVGGGLGRGGLHSVVEPAAAGIPVLFGPRHARREADDLLERGGALEVDPDSAAQVLGRLLADGEERVRMGRAAGAYVEEGRGAAERTADLLEALLEDAVP